MIKRYINIYMWSKTKIRTQRTSYWPTQSTTPTKIGSIRKDCRFTRMDTLNFRFKQSLNLLTRAIKTANPTFNDKRWFHTHILMIVLKHEWDYRGFVAKKHFASKAIKDHLIRLSWGNWVVFFNEWNAKRLEYWTFDVMCLPWSVRTGRDGIKLDSDRKSWLVNCSKGTTLSSVTMYASKRHITHKREHIFPILNRFFIHRDISICQVWEELLEFLPFAGLKDGVLF